MVMPYVFRSSKHKNDKKIPQTINLASLQENTQGPQGLHSLNILILHIYIHMYRTYDSPKIKLVDDNG